MQPTPGTGWVQPSEQAATPTRSLLRGLLGLPACALIAWITIQLIARAWDARGDAEPPYLSALLFLYLPLIGLGQLIAWEVGAFLTRRWRWWLGVPFATAVAVLIGWGAIALNVPMNPASYYAPAVGAASGDNYLPDTCRPNGQPTWWPDWLPL